jgi:hypothetical protein
MTRFFRLSTDQQMTPAAWDDACSGPTPGACWLIGGGPSLSRLPCSDIARSPAPKMAVNLAGTRLIRPDFWTAYDPSIRFHRSLYLDAGVVKFLPRHRAMDVVPETTFKVCECPQTYFFDRDPRRGYHDFLSPSAAGVVDWADSLVQAIDILYRLGFRRIFLAGCELCVRPSDEWVRRGAEVGATYADGEPLDGFARRCRERGMSDAEMEQLGVGPLYHFDEAKPFAAALRTDGHYFRVVQSLRLSRRSLSAAGVRLISVTPGSRLNHFFEYRSVETALDELRCEIGDPDEEPTRGLYTQMIERPTPAAGLMRDLMPPQAAGRASCRCGRTSARRQAGAQVERELPLPPQTERLEDRRSLVGARSGPVGDSFPELIVENEGWSPITELFVEPDELA